MKIEQLYEGAYLLHGEVGGRPLQLPLLLGEGKALLVDTGCVRHVEDLILPAFRKLNIPIAALCFIVNTHCDFDHVGGNYRLKALAPRALLCCGDSDREQIESPETLYCNRYDKYRSEGIFYSDDVRAWIMECMDRPQMVDLTLRGGERIRLASDCDLQVVHLPGHSHGHLGLFDRRYRALFAGDAIHGAEYLDLGGKPALCPTYLYPGEYRQTIDFVDSLDLALYAGCHWPVKRNEEVHYFCKESLAFVQLAEDLIMAALAEPKTLRELCREVGPRLGSWPVEANNDLCYAFVGHLDDLERRGLVRKLPGHAPACYQHSIDL